MLGYSVQQQRVPDDLADAEVARANGATFVSLETVHPVRHEDEERVSPDTVMADVSGVSNGMHRLPNASEHQQHLKSAIRLCLEAVERDEIMSFELENLAHRIVERKCNETSDQHQFVLKHFNAIGCQMSTSYPKPNRSQAGKRHRSNALTYAAAALAPKLFNEVSSAHEVAWVPSEKPVADSTTTQDAKDLKLVVSAISKADPDRAARAITRFLRN